MSSKEITKRMIALRKVKGYTQQDLAYHSGVSIATIRNIEQGKGWSSETMDKINEVLDGAVY